MGAYLAGGQLSGQRLWPGGYDRQCLGVDGRLVEHAGRRARRHIAGPRPGHGAQPRSPGKSASVYSTPYPSAPGAANVGPCPDPDATGPVNDIRALYPTTVMSPEARIGTDEYLIFEGEGSWPDPPWWAST